MAAVNVTWEQYVLLKKNLEKSDASVDELKDNLNQFFLIVLGMVVYLMQGGFAFLEAGAVRSKNSTNILIKNLMDSFIAGIAYWLIGYPLAYGKGNTFIGYSNFASHELPENGFAGFFFQYVFAATAATIVSGALAERCEFIAFFIYSFFLTSFMYPVVTHWVWTEEGWLVNGAQYGEGNNTFTVGYQDFAGSGVVHILGGTAAFIGAMLLGPRIGRFHPDQRGPVDLRGHSVPFAALGGFILIFGFFAFNGGSALSITKKGDGASVGLSVVNTIISGSMSAFVSLIIHKTKSFGNQHWSLLSTLNGCLAGMVAICAGCNEYRPWAAVIVGFFAAISFKLWSNFMIALKIDDPLDAVAVHYGGGLWGVIAVAFLKNDEGIVFARDTKSALGLAWQLAGAASITAWTAGLCLIMFGFLRLIGKFRVHPDLERKGLDIPKHGEPAYPMESYGHGWIEHITKVLENGQLSEITQVASSDSTDNLKEYAKGFDSLELQATRSGQFEIDTDVNHTHLHEKGHFHTTAAAHFKPKPNPDQNSTAKSQSNGGPAVSSEKHAAVRM